MNLFLKFATGLLSVMLILVAAPPMHADAAKTAESVPAATADMAKEMNRTLALKRPLRIGVTTFNGTGNGADNRFGEHLTETLTSALQKESRLFRLFERNRLNLILKENALSLSGLIDEKQAQQVGELAPLDAILSGTYTPLKDAIVINARLVDVVTGEILFAHHGQVAMSDNLRALFVVPESEKKKPTKPVPPEIACRADWQHIKALLRDISTPAAIRRVVDAAIEIPFDSPCGRIHYNVGSAFLRYKVSDDRYHDFLVQALRTARLSDRRIAVAIDYLAADGEISDTEWQACLPIVQQLAPHRLDNYMETLLLPSAEAKPDMGVIKDRIREYFALVEAKKIGRPVPANFDTAFEELLSGMIRFSPYRSAHMGPAIYVYKTYGSDASPAVQAKMYKPLKNMYLGEFDADRKQQIIGYLCSHFQSREVNADLGDDMYEFANALKDKRNIEKKRANPADLPRLVNGCRERFAQALTLVEYRSQREDRIEFCFEQQIDCPGLIPSVDECAERLFSDRYEDRMEAAKILIQMGPKAAPAEKKILKMIRRVKRKSFSGATNLEQAGVTILGNIRTDTPEALALLVEALDSRRHMVSSMAGDALAQIGPPAIPALLKVVVSGSGGAQYKAIKALEKMGPDARAAATVLKAKLKEEKNLDIRDALEDALEKISDG